MKVETKSLPSRKQDVGQGQIGEDMKAFAKLLGVKL